MPHLLKNYGSIPLLAKKHSVCVCRHTKLQEKTSFPSAFAGRSIRVWVWSAANCEGWWNPLGRSWDASDWPAMLRWLESCWLWVHNAVSCRCVFFWVSSGAGEGVDLGEEGKGVQRWVLLEIRKLATRLPFLPWSTEPRYFKGNGPGGPIFHFYEYGREYFAEEGRTDDG